MTDMITLVDGCLKRENEPPCKGLFFRVRDSRYFSSNGGICRKREYVILKRLSCKGCGSCGWMYESLQESELDFIDGGDHGDVVELRMTNVYRDWETGYVDDYDLQFMKVKK